MQGGRTHKLVQDIPLSVKQALDRRSAETGITIRDLVLEAWTAYLAETDPNPAEETGSAKLVLDVPSDLKERAMDRKKIAGETIKAQILAALERRYGIR
ncbi:hypothetical protein [Symbiobacterium terraclitae]|uniref:hypothetical protein n=1 Tax=Symbiobacterium terraclitae TaxID=557451 RepID=UPI0035B4FE26